MDAELPLRVRVRTTLRTRPELRNLIAPWVRERLLLRDKARAVSARLRPPRWRSLHATSWAMASRVRAIASSGTNRAASRARPWPGGLAIFGTGPTAARSCAGTLGHATIGRSRLRRSSRSRSLRAGLVGTDRPSAPCGALRSRPRGSRGQAGATRDRGESRFQTPRNGDASRGPCFAISVGPRLRPNRGPSSVG